MERPSSRRYSTHHRDMLLATAFDRVSLARKGLGYERLDQLTMELLLGVREGDVDMRVRSMAAASWAADRGHPRRPTSLRGAAPTRVMLLDGESGGPYHNGR